MRRFEGVAILLLLAYLTLQVFPQVLFGHSLTVENITVYSRTPIPQEASSCLARTAKLVRESELSIANRCERIFICDNPWLFSFFCPLRGKAFGASWPITDYVFVARTDFSRNLVTSANTQYNTRSFSSVVAHEITHGLIRHRLGFIRAQALPPWVQEGYCDYIARDSSFPVDQGLRMIAEGRNENSASFRYFVYRQMVTYLIDNQQYSFAQVVHRASEEKVVAEETCKAIVARQSR